MKILNYFSNFTNAIKTFPLSFVCLLVLTLLCIWETANWFDSFKYIGEFAGAMVLTLLLSLYGPLLSLHHQDWWNRKYRLINYWLQVLSIIIWWIYFYLLMQLTISKAATATAMLYLWVFPIVFLWIILLISSLLRRAEEDIWIAWANILESVAFWVLAGLIVRWGLSSALASIEALFDVDVSYRRYSYFWAFSMILLTGSFILNYYLISTENNAIILPSRIRKIFGCYIILPLALIYLVIFLAYGIKILITWEWPRGIIVRLGCWYFVLWMICYYLTYPEKTTLFEIFHRILFASFLYVVWMMWCAILKRMNQYWLTTNRYYICALVISIALFSILALWFQRRRLLSLIAVFFCATLISVYGPINATSMTLFSQKSRITTLLEKENIQLPLTDNSLANLTWDSARLVAWALDEILDNYEVEDWSWSLISSENLTGNYRWYYFRSNIHSLLWLENEYSVNSNQYFSFRTSRNEEWIDVQWFSKIYEISYEVSKNNIMELPKNIGWELNITQYIDELYEKTQSYEWSRNEEQEPFIIEEEGRKYIIESMNWEKNSDWIINIKWISWYLLVK